MEEMALPPGLGVTWGEGLLQPLELPSGGQPRVSRVAEQLAPKSF